MYITSILCVQDLGTEHGAANTEGSPPPYQPGYGTTDNAPPPTYTPSSYSGKVIIILFWQAYWLHKVKNYNVVASSAILLSQMRNFTSCWSKFDDICNVNNKLLFDVL